MKDEAAVCSPMHLASSQRKTEASHAKRLPDLGESPHNLDAASRVKTVGETSEQPGLAL